MDKYNGIKTAIVLSGGEEIETIPAPRQKHRIEIDSAPKSKKSHPFLIKTAICCLFVALFILFSYIDNSVVRDALDGIYSVITYDMMGTDASSCLVNSWLAGILPQ